MRGILNNGPHERRRNGEAPIGDTIAHPRRPRSEPPTGLLRSADTMLDIMPAELSATHIDRRRDTGCFEFVTICRKRNHIQDS